MIACDKTPGCGRPKFHIGKCIVLERRVPQLARNAGERLRNAGMASATHAEDAPWRAVANRVLIELARLGAPFTSEDVTKRAGRPQHENAVGALIGGWSRRKVIEAVGMEKAQDADAHARRLILWRGTAKAWKAEFDDPNGP